MHYKLVDVMMNHAVSMRGLFYEMFFNVICVYVVTKDSNGKDYLLTMWRHHCRNDKTTKKIRRSTRKTKPFYFYGT